LVNDDTADFSRPDRMHYVIDVMPLLEVKHTVSSTP
jgi:hypothetical protein